jgi:Double zinc ribbon
VSDLERFFRQLVRNLAASDPGRLRRPLPLADIRDSIVPYRANRRVLQLESSEDYELVLMQLCAGEGGFAITEPEEIQELFGAEVRSTNPDLGLLQLHENAVVSLRAGPVAEALNPEPDLAFAPPGTVEAPRLHQPSFSEAEPLLDHALQDDTATHCSQCAAVLPPDRLVNFCPHCGADQARPRCSACQASVEAGWRHCVTCGAVLKDN